MKLNLKKQAQYLRKRGFSLPDISKKLDVSKSTASLWCRDIQLTIEQKKSLEQRTNRKLKKFFKFVERQKSDRLKVKNEILKNARNEIGRLSKRDILIAGASLYWAEGFKHSAESRVGFCNSDPEMVKFMILFLEKCLKVEKADLSPRLTLNEAYKNRVEIIQKYWSSYLNIPKSQFTKPFYQRVKQVKIYSNPENYHGVLRIHVKKSSKLLTKIRGYLFGLKGNNLNS